MSRYVEPNSKLCPGGEPIWYDLIAISPTKLREVEKTLRRTRRRRESRNSLTSRKQIQDLFVENAAKALLYLGESYILVRERRREGMNAVRYDLFS
jgi:hypothetical protein